MDQLKSLSKGATTIFKQEAVPIFQNKVYSSIEESKKAQIGRVELVISNHTGFIFNKAFDNNLMNYDKNYHNEQTNSLKFKHHLNEVFEIINCIGLENKKIVEVGCGKGHFIELLKSKNIDCIGFDPSYEGNDPSIVKDYFSSKYKINADVIILRHTLEHIENPHLFICEIAKINNFKGMIFIEVPTFDWIYQKQAFWDIFYEHCNYFTEGSLSNIFSTSKTGSFFGGQYIYCLAELKKINTIIEKQQNLFFHEINFDLNIEKWKNYLNEKKNIAIWGAGAKGSTFLNLLDNQNKLIKCVIDINIEKQGKFIAHTGHPIYSPAFLNREKIENIIVMNENYLQEIKESMAGLDINFISL